MTKILFSAVGLLALVGCSSMSTVAMKRAAYDFDCSEKEIKIKNVSGDTYVAKGCGKKALYTCRTTSINPITAASTYSCLPEKANADIDTAVLESPHPDTNAALQNQMMMQSAPVAPAGGF